MSDNNIDIAHYQGSQGLQSPQSPQSPQGFQSPQSPQSPQFPQGHRDPQNTYHQNSSQPYIPAPQPQYTGYMPPQQPQTQPIQQPFPQQGAQQQPQQQQFQQQQQQQKPNAPFERLRENLDYENEMSQAPDEYVEYESFMNGTLDYAEQLGLDGETVEKTLDEAWKNGLSSEQAMFMLEQMPKVDNQLSTQKLDRTLQKIEISEQVLKNVWGAQFDRNVQKIEQYANSRYPNQPEEAEQLLVNILSDVNLAQTTLSGIGSGGSLLGNSGGQPPVPQQGVVLDEGSDLRSLEKAWTDLKSDPKSPVYSKDFRVREPAQQELNRLAQLIYQQKINQNRGFGAGF